MTTTLSKAATPAATVSWSRWAVALLMPVGPAAVAVLRYVLPYDLDSTTGMVAGIAENMTAMGWVVALSLVALLTLVPGAYAVLGLTRPGAPRLTTAVAVLLVPGYLALTGGGMAGDLIAYGGLKAGIAQPVLVDVIDSVNALVVPNIALGIFVVGHVLGTVLLGFALWKSRVVGPAWAVVMGVSQPLHFTAVMTGSHLLDLFAWGMTAAAMTVLAAVLVRTPEQRG
jgi:hypothetical protein